MKMSMWTDLLPAACPQQQMEYSWLAGILGFNEILVFIWNLTERKGVQLANYSSGPLKGLLIPWPDHSRAHWRFAPVWGQKRFFLSFSLFLVLFFKQKHLDTHLSMTPLKKGQSNWAGFHLYVSFSAQTGPIHLLSLCYYFLSFSSGLCQSLAPTSMPHFLNWFPTAEEEVAGPSLWPVQFL
jgi:hypothetical protein